MPKKILASSLLILFIHVVASSQTLLVQVKPAGSQLWSFVDLKGNTVIAPQFHMNKVCFHFSGNGYAAVYEKENNKYYFINTRGEKLKTEISNFNLIGFEGFNTEGFHDGRIAVNYNNRWGYLNDSGKVVIRAKYSRATSFNDGYAVVKNEEKYYVIDVSGKEIALEATDVVLVRHFSENLAPFRAMSKKFGFINVQGKTIIPAQFDAVGYFANGMAWAKFGDLVGYINGRGEWVIKPQFQAGRDFDPESGMALVKLKGNFRYAKMSGEVVTLLDTDERGEFSEGLARGKKNGLKGYYDNSGSWVIKPQFDDARDFKNGFASVNIAGKWGLINKKGDWVIEPGFKDMKEVDLIR